VYSCNESPVLSDSAGPRSQNAYYDASWRVIETRNGSNQTISQMCWGTRYTDELLWFEVNGDPTIGNDANPDNTATGEGGESPADHRYFVHQDRNWNVIALTDYVPGGGTTGAVVERYSYTPYGEFVIHKGQVSGNELGNLLPSSTIGNVFAHQGLPMDWEKDSYHNRRREYGAALRSFEQREPAEGSGATLLYRDGMRLYTYTRSRPISLTDPSGKAATCPFGNVTSTTPFAQSCYLGFGTMNCQGCRRCQLDYSLFNKGICPFTYVYLGDVCTGCYCIGTPPPPPACPSSWTSQGNNDIAWFSCNKLCNSYSNTDCYSCCEVMWRNNALFPPGLPETLEHCQNKCDESYPG
jgi:RHS repeat-associated protein